MTIDQIAAFMCIDCDTDTWELGEYYIVWDDVWQAAGASTKWRWGMLCIGCLEERLGRQLNRDDFKPAPVNRVAIVTPHLSDRMIERTSA